MLAKPTYALIIDGVKWDFWSSLSLSRAIDRMGGEFRAELTTKPEEGFLSSTMKAGLPVQVEIDGNTVLDGYIDIVTHRYNATSASISVVGRDKTADLIDCAATTDGPYEFRGQKLDAIIRHVIKPFGINLTVQADVGAAFSRVAIQPGETAYDFIERACRFRAVLAVSDGIGGIVIIKPEDAPAAGEIVYGKNILEGSVTLDWTNRFSLYVLKGQAEGSDSSSAEETSSPEGRASDELVTRHRPTVITSEAQGFGQTMKERSEWECKVRRGRSVAASYVVQGWYEDAHSKSLWRPNTKTKVSDPKRAVQRELLIISVNYTIDGTGTKTRLDLALPEAYNLVAEIEPESDDVLGAA